MMITTIGIDLSKNVFQVHGVDERGHAVAIMHQNLQPGAASVGKKIGMVRLRLAKYPHHLSGSSESSVF